MLLLTLPPRTSPGLMLVDMGFEQAGALDLTRYAAPSSRVGQPPRRNAGRDMTRIVTLPQRLHALSEANLMHKDAITHRR